MNQRKYKPNKTKLDKRTTTPKPNKQQKLKRKQKQIK